MTRSSYVQELYYIKKYLLEIFYLQGIILSTGDAAVNQMDPDLLYSCQIYIWAYVLAVFNMEFSEAFTMNVIASNQHFPLFLLEN